jgi:hypothetical protein
MISPWIISAVLLNVEKLKVVRTNTSRDLTIAAATVAVVRKPDSLSKDIPKATANVLDTVVCRHFFFNQSRLEPINSLASQPYSAVTEGGHNSSVMAKPDNFDDSDDSDENRDDNDLGIFEETHPSSEDPLDLFRVNDTSSYDM